jgi:hypothetical protein
LPGGPVPCDWTVTSDSIAARVARALSAELVLLKSVSLPPGTGIARAVHSQYVDRCFLRAAVGLHRIRCVNLRQPEFPETVWTGT